MLVLLVVQVTLEVFAAVSQPLEGEVAAVLLVRVVEQVAARDGIGLAREVESLCEEGFGAGQGALCQNAKCDFGVSRPRIGRVDEEHRKRCLFGNHGRGPDKEWWEATYQSEAVLVPCDEGAAEGFDRCDGGLGSLGDGDVDVRSAEVFDALCVFDNSTSTSANPCQFQWGWQGHDAATKRKREKRTSPRSLTPSWIPWIHRVSASSRIVIGREGSIKPRSIQCCNRSRLSGTRFCFDLHVSGVGLSALRDAEVSRS